MKTPGNQRINPTINIAYIGLGSNLNNPEQQITTALQQLAKIPNCSIHRQSSLYQSKAVGPGEQNDYINAVVELRTGLQADKLLASLQELETAQGRTRNIRWEPRTLDLDILLYNQITISSEYLNVPHPEMKNRNFVLYPLAEIAPDIQLPCGAKISELLKRCSAQGLIKITADKYSIDSKTCDSNLVHSH